MILSFSNNELITSYEAERIPSNSIYQKLYGKTRFPIQLVTFNILSDRVSQA